MINFDLFRPIRGGNPKVASEMETTAGNLVMEALVRTNPPSHKTQCIRIATTGQKEPFPAEAHYETQGIGHRPGPNLEACDIRSRSCQDMLAGVLLRVAVAASLRYGT